MAIITIGLGFMMLIAGRSLYPVFTGGVGFIASLLLIKYFPLPSGWDPIYAALIVGGVVAVLTYLLHRPVAWVCGAAAGAYLVTALPIAIGGAPLVDGALLYIIMGVAAVVCVLGLLFLFDISLVVLSALTAVTMIQQHLRVDLIPPAGMFIILLMVGLILQYLLLQYGAPSPD